MSLFDRHQALGLSNPFECEERRPGDGLAGSEIEADLRGGGARCARRSVAAARQRVPAHSDGKLPAEMYPERRHVRHADLTTPQQCASV